MSRLNFCSVAPSSTSASSATNRRRQGAGREFRESKSARSFPGASGNLRTQHAREAVFCGELNHCWLVVCQAIRCCWPDSVFFGSRILNTCARFVFALRLHLITRKRRARNDLAARIAHGAVNRRPEKLRYGQGLENVAVCAARRCGPGPNRAASDPRRVLRGAAACLHGELQFRAQIFFADHFTAPRRICTSCSFTGGNLFVRAHFAADPASRLRDAATTASSFDAIFAGEHQTHCFGVNSVFFGEDARRERFFGVGVADRHCGLHYDRPCVEAFIDKVNRASGKFHAVLDELGVALRGRETRAEATDEYSEFSAERLQRNRRRAAA